MSGTVYVVALLACIMLAVDASSCSNVVFSDPQKWGVDPQFSLLWNLTLPSEPIPFNQSSSPVCSYYSGQDVCCNGQVLNAIAAAVNRTKTSLNEAQTAINHEELIQAITQMLELFTQNSTVVDDIVALNRSIAALKNAQSQCVNALSAYTEGMLCFACSPNASRFVEEQRLAFLLSTDTCTGVVARCTPVFDASRGVLVTLFSIVSKLFSYDDPEIMALPDMCGGTEAAPGNCSDFMCNTWLSGIRIPSYTWDLEAAVNKSAMREASVSPQDVVRSLHQLLRRRLAPLQSAIAATVATNVYSVDGYPALSVGCANNDCTMPGHDDDSGSHTLAIALGVSGGVVLVAVVALIARRRKSREGYGENDTMLANNKGYDAL